MLTLVVLISFSVYSQTKSSGNPVFGGWYADPEAIIFDESCWIYPTYSAHAEVPDSSAVHTDWQKNERQNNKPWTPFLLQTFFNAFSAILTNISVTAIQVINKSIDYYVPFFIFASIEKIVT
ncbi:MAG: hypothetical protein JXR22_12260 [Prolixibacteraceae bacterium]|nr:hypothetical protein [Prolixibacteraceae bacterium]